MVLISVLMVQIAGTDAYTCTFLVPKWGWRRNKGSWF